MRNRPIKFVMMICLIIGIIGQVYAQNDSNSVHGYSADISKPTESYSSSSDDVMANETKPTASCNAQWQAYCQPIRECIQGDTIIPTKGNKIFSYLFNNDADTNATVSILGWKNNKCHIDFKEGTLIKSCALNRRVLRELMSQLLNPDQFNPAGAFAQNLVGSC